MISLIGFVQGGIDIAFLVTVKYTLDAPRWLGITLFLQIFAFAPGLCGWFPEQHRPANFSFCIAPDITLLAPQLHSTRSSASDEVLPNDFRYISSLQLVSP